MTNFDPTMVCDSRPYSALEELVKLIRTTSRACGMVYQLTPETVGVWAMAVFLV